MLSKIRSRMAERRLPPAERTTRKILRGERIPEQASWAAVADTVAGLHRSEEPFPESALGRLLARSDVPPHAKDLAVSALMLGDRNGIRHVTHTTLTGILGAEGVGEKVKALVIRRGWTSILVTDRAAPDYRETLKVQQQVVTDAVALSPHRSDRLALEILRRYAVGSIDAEALLYGVSVLVEATDAALEVLWTLVDDKHNRGHYPGPEDYPELLGQVDLILN